MDGFVQCLKKSTCNLLSENLRFVRHAELLAASVSNLMTVLQKILVQLYRN